MVTAEVIKLRWDAFEDFLDDILLAYRENRIEGISCIAQIKYPDGERPDGFKAKIDKYWFGFDSCTLVLGMLEIMKGEVLSYMAELNSE